MNKNKNKNKNQSQSRDQKPETMTDDQLEAYINSMDDHTDQGILVHAVEVAERRESIRIMFPDLVQPFWDEKG